MKYDHNTDIIKHLINKQMSNKNDVFAYYSEQVSDWFVCSRYIVDGEMWSYRINRSLSNHVKGSISYLSLYTENYENNYGYFSAMNKDLHKFSDILLHLPTYHFTFHKILTIVKKEHRIALRHGRNTIDVKALML